MRISKRCRGAQTVIPKQPAPDVIRGEHRLPEKIMSGNKLGRDEDSQKRHPALAGV
jgi:hypothetical protein